MLLSSSDSIRIAKTDWESDKPALKQIRQEVFIDEQKVPDSLEWDDLDRSSSHYLALNSSGTPIGSARVTQDNQISRMAVKHGCRNAGVGSTLLSSIIKIHQTKDSIPLYLHAQDHAISFYEQFGFQTQGNGFVDAGIPHHLMVFSETSTTSEQK